jgi:acyl carrier protein
MIDPRTDITDRLNRIFRKVFDDDSIEVFDKMTAKDIPGWDSLTHITLIVALEKEFNMRFHVGDIGKLENVGGMIDLISAKIN